MSEYQPHWAESLKEGDTVLATLRHETDGAKSLHNVYCKVLTVHPHLRSIYAYTMHGKRVIDFCELREYSHELRTRDKTCLEYIAQYDEQYRDQSDIDFTEGWDACKKYLEAHFEFTPKEFHNFNLEPKNLYAPVQSEQFGLQVTFYPAQCHVCGQRMDTKVKHPTCLLVEGTGSYNPCPYGLPANKPANA